MSTDLAWQSLGVAWGNLILIVLVTVALALTGSWAVEIFGGRAVHRSGRQSHRAQVTGGANRPAPEALCPIHHLRLVRGGRDMPYDWDRDGGDA